ncbi:hypothetical protein AB0I84_06100 [Streptomyces spectabilis]|uniref:hypothetical protein n=1 Tax=Streptomyces spectabilis TaxID=68270 RepID=UPI0033CCB943
MTSTSPEAQPTGPAARAVPTPEAVQAALITLVRAWSPGTLLPGDPLPALGEHDGADEEFDAYDGCCCAGTDDDGEPLGCNCAAGCSCAACSYFDYQRHARCSAGAVSIGTHCTAETAFQVVTYRMQHGLLAVEREQGAACPHPGEALCHCTPTTVVHESGLRPHTYGTRSACSIEHAQHIIRGEQARHRPGSEWQYYIERYQHIPHDNDLPDPLPQLRHLIGSASNSVAFLTRLTTRHTNAPDLELAMRQLRRTLAQTAWEASHPLDLPGNEDDFEPPSGPVQEEPPEPEGPFGHDAAG